VFRFIAVCFAQILLVGSVCVANSQGVTSSQKPRWPYGVPEASLPCTPEEQTWWTELRAASEEVRYPHRPGEKQKKKFLDVLREGEEKSYKPPVPDTQAVMLFRTEPMYTEQARHDRVRGRVVLQVEFLADGTVGKVEVIEGLPGSGLNEASEDAARKTIFLPAVKNRQFVAWSTRVVMHFEIY